MGACRPLRADAGVRVHADGEASAARGGIGLNSDRKWRCRLAVAKMQSPLRHVLVHFRVISIQQGEQDETGGRLGVDPSATRMNRQGGLYRLYRAAA